MSRIVKLMVLVVLASWSRAALAKPWNGLDPGVASVIDVIGKFGEPGKRVTLKGKDVLVYSGDRALKGAVQVQFKVDPKSQTVERIDLYPEPVITSAQIQKSYGEACAAHGPVEPCFYSRETPTKHRYFLYLKLGLAIFFKDDNETVKSFSFLPAGSSPAP